MIDFQGHPIRYDGVAVYEEIIAQGRAERLDLQVQEEGRSAWRSIGSTQFVAGEGAWRSDLQRGAQQLRETTYVRANDPHYDAKLFPVIHPFGTGSLLSEFGTGAMQKHCRARALTLQAWFRRSSLWCFWQLDLSIKNALFWKNSTRRRMGRTSSPGTPGDNFSKWFGTIVPSSIPDSTAWWRLALFVNLNRMLCC